MAAVVLKPAVTGCASCPVPALQLVPRRCPDASSHGEGKRGVSSNKQELEMQRSPQPARRTGGRADGEGGAEAVFWSVCQHGKEKEEVEEEEELCFLLSAFWPCVVAPWVPWREPQPGQEPQPHST